VLAGLTKRLPESAVQLISSCNSSSLRELRLEVGRRGIAAVAADQLDHLGFMSQLTGLSLALSKGGLPAGKSARQLEKLSGGWPPTHGLIGDGRGRGGRGACGWTSSQAGCGLEGQGASRLDGLRDWDREGAGMRRGGEGGGFAGCAGMGV